MKKLIIYISIIFLLTGCYAASFSLDNGLKTGLSLGKGIKGSPRKVGAIPPAITDNLIGWWDAGFGTYTDRNCQQGTSANNDRIACWQNLIFGSAEDEKLVDIDNSTKPTLKTAHLNGLPGILYNGSTLRSELKTSGGNITVFVVYEFITDKTGMLFQILPTSGEQPTLLYNSAVWIVRARNATEQFGSNMPADNTAYIIDFRITGTGKSDFEYRLGGSVQSVTGDGNTNSGGATSFSSGEDAANVERLNGYIMKILVYDTNLSDAERTSVFNQLKTEYGL